MKHYIENHLSKVNKLILDETEQKSIASLNLKITATHAGRINNNNVFYTPRSMEEGVTSLLVPFKKHLQKGHNGKAIGVITDSNYIDISKEYPELSSIYTRIQTAATPKDLVEAVKELVNHPIAKKKEFKGLGITELRATLYNKDFIQDLVSGENKGQVSIGGESDKVYCSVCAEAFRQNHRHKRGSYYKDELCFAIYDKMTLDHVGFVSNPADTETNTTILDSDNDISDSNIEVITYEIKDNLQGNNTNMKLTYNQLTETASSPEKLVNLFGENLSEVKIKELTSQLESNKPTIDSAFLLATDKLLPVNTKLGVAVAKKLIEMLDDTVGEKEALQSLINTQVELQFNGQSLEDFETDLLKEAEPEVPEVDTSKEFLAQLFSKEGAEAFAEVISKKIVELTPAVEAPISDSQTTSYTVLMDRNKTLEQDIRIIQDSVSALTTELRDAIIDQILSKKGLTKDSEYFTEVLSKRDIDQLKATLEDLSFETPKEVETDPAKEKPLEKTNIKDSLDDEQNGKKKDPEDPKDNPGKIEDHTTLSKSELIAKYGYTKALQLIKSKK